MVEILASDSSGIKMTGISIPGSPNDNLCLNAYRLLRDDFNLPPIQIHLHKIIPTGAGLGGGSSDAAYTLRLLNKLFVLNLSVDQLMKYATLVGSDCAFFVQDLPMIGTGRGEVLEPVNLNLKGYYLVLLTPEIHLSTASAYAGVTPAIPPTGLRALIDEPIARWRDTVKNDFEASIFQRHPAIQALKEKLYLLGALFASMSGSGSSVFGIFEKEIKTEECFSDVSGWSGWL